MGTIPRLIHRIWFGSQPIPPAYETWWQAWQRQLPSYQFITWTDNHIAALSSVADKIVEADSFARKADIARYEILRQHGGVYIDCDMIPLHHLDFASCETDLLVLEPKVFANCTLCQNDMFAVRPHHPVFERAVSLIKEKNINAEPVVMGTGPGFFASLVVGTPYLALPDSAFNPYIFEEPFSVLFSRNLDSSYGIHMWANSWTPPSWIARRLNLMIQQGDLTEIEKLSQNTSLSDLDKDRTMDYTHHTRAARQSIVAASQTFLLKELLNTDDNTYFDAWKLCHYIFSIRSEPPSAESIVWHIGAGHSRMAYRLRPAFINFDPRSVLLEADPALLEQLVRSYANNRQIRFLHGALSLPPVDGSCDIESLRAGSGGAGPDILAISVVGQEIPILLHLFEQGVRPALLFLSLNQADAGKIGELKETVLHNYRVFTFNDYIAAYRKDILFNYCKILFVEYGHTTIFKGAATMVSAH